MIVTTSYLFRIRWYCSNCNSIYNPDVIEQGLIDAVQRRSMAFVLQDLVCTKCHGVSHGVVPVIKKTVDTFQQVHGGRA